MTAKVSGQRRDSEVKINEEDQIRKMAFLVFANGSDRVDETDILILANSYSWEQEQIDSAIEKVDTEYDGYLKYAAFVKFLEMLDPLLEDKKKGETQRSGKSEKEDSENGSKDGTEKQDDKEEDKSEAKESGRQTKRNKIKKGRAKSRVETLSNKPPQVPEHIQANAVVPHSTLQPDARVMSLIK